MSERMYRRVEQYASFGMHRTGGEADRPTAEWMADQLRNIGLRVTLDDVPFDQCITASRLSIDGEPVEHLVVPYEWTGQVDTDDVTVRRFDAEFGGRPNPLDMAIAELSEPGRPLILATGDSAASLRAINRRVHTGSGIPTVLVAGRDHDRMIGANVRLRLDVERVPGTTTNVFAATPAATPSTPTAVLSTPLNGWFTCAGERGTGVAVLLELVERFSDQPLLVVATGGHELSYFGADHWQTQTSEGASPHTSLGVGPLSCVVHIGASIAVEEFDAPAPRPLAADRLAMTSLPSTATDEMFAALERANLNLTSGATSWLGEAEVFQAFDLPMLSLTGAGHFFHCPEDTPANSTSPAGLTTAADAIGDALDHFFELV